MKRQILKTDGESNSEYYFSPLKNNHAKLRSKTSKDEKGNIYIFPLFLYFLQSNSNVK